MLTDSSPIVAIATPPGRGGIGIVRISSGTQADLSALTAALLGATKAAQLRPRQAMFTAFLEADGTTIDQGLALLFPAPHSYTGETVLELQGHGGPVVMQLLLTRCLVAGQSIGLRLAEPGEFTRRAFLNEQLDLAQAEAVADLIDASTAAAARSAQRSLAGEFSRQVHQLTDALIELRALVEATLDFPDEEIDFLQASDAQGRLAGIAQALAQLLDRAQQGALLREGMHVVLAGSPNVGKSSLLNALAGEEIAIVTPIAGTTRDRIRQTISLQGVPLHVVDTAGIRTPEQALDEVERIGIERSLQEIARADVVLHLIDATKPVADEQVLAQVRSRVTAPVPLITVRNKIDLTHEPASESRDSTFNAAANIVNVSALSGAGLDALRARLLQIAGWHADSDGSGSFLARERQLDALRRAQSHLVQAVSLVERACRSTTDKDPAAPAADAQLELLAEELRLAGRALGEITGEVSADDLLGQIFSRFCIGK